MKTPELDVAMTERISETAERLREKTRTAELDMDQTATVNFSLSEALRWAEYAEKQIAEYATGA